LKADAIPWHIFILPAAFVLAKMFHHGLLTLKRSVAEIATEL